MRIGLNEVKGVGLDGYLRHRIVVPVYIPKLEGYFEHALEILKLCLESLRLTTAGKASVTIVSNGSIEPVTNELRQQYETGWIDQLVLNQQNRGRVDGVVPAARGAFEPFITITDCDVLFRPGWLEAVEDVFRTFPECGFVSPAPNPIFSWYYTSATTLGGLLTRELGFEKVVPDEDLDRFAHSINRTDLYRPEHRESQLVVKRNGSTACVGCGHFVFTIRREVMAAYPRDPCLKAMGGGSPQIHDLPPDKLGYWRLATTQAFAYHLGNTPEPWMREALLNYRTIAADRVAEEIPAAEAKAFEARRRWSSRLPLRCRQLLARVHQKAYSLRRQKPRRQKQQSKNIPKHKKVVPLMMKPLLLIPDGVGVRNFLLGSFLRELSAATETAVMHVVPDEQLASYETGLGNDIQWRSLIPYRESKVSFTLRYSLSYAQMYWGDSQAMRYVRNSPLRGGWRTRSVMQTARLIGRMAATPDGIRKLENWHCAAVTRLPEVQHYRRVFAELSPTLLFCSHQRPPLILPAVMAAKSLGIPTATFIFSWDNLTSKGRIAAPFDHYLVWSDHMKEELLRYYPDVTANRVHVVGTPQFDPYADKSLLWRREEFFRRIGADPERPLICYTGGDTGISPEDEARVRLLMELVRSGRIKNNPQVLVRPAPVDPGTRYDSVRHDFPELIYARPQWTHENRSTWRGTMPTAADIQFLANLTYHADLNVNQASTITLDFAIRDKPIVNIAFDINDPPPFGTPLWDFFYQWEHYRPVVDLKAARFAKSPDELASYVNAYLENPALDREGRRRLVALEVGYPIGQSVRRMLEVLRRLGSGQNVSEPVLQTTQLRAKAHVA